MHFDAKSMEHLEKAVSQGCLWPSVHSAAEVYLRRERSDAHAYELVWRLIHLWECIAITLATTTISWLRDRPEFAADYDLMRRKCYGLGHDESGQPVKRMGALDGSLDKWIEILRDLVKLKPTDASSYLARVRLFLQGDSEKNLNVSPFLLEWEKACDVSLAPKPEASVSPSAAFHIVNLFRNRFAHVPFPHDRVDSIYRNLALLTNAFFSLAQPWLPESVLGGAMLKSSSWIRGNDLGRLNAQLPSSQTDVYFVHGAKKSKSGFSYEESWVATPFAHVDSMLRPFILTRLKNREHGKWEFTRYLAEANAVLEIENKQWLTLFPNPEDDASPEPESTSKASSGGATGSSLDAVTDVHSAFNAIFERRFEVAIDFLRSHLDANPKYHVGWLRLAYALREWAKQQTTKDEEASLLKESLEAAKRAASHVDRSYQAEAHYQRSKTLWRLSETTEGSESEKYYLEARQSAEKAQSLFSEARFDTWQDYLARKAR